MQYKLNDDDKTLAHNPADQPKDPKKAMKKVSSNLKKASKAHAKQSKQLAIQRVLLMLVVASS